MSKGRVLLLEDDVQLSDTVSEYLSERGYSVECAYDGLSAQDILYEKSFDILLLDVKVPELNGFEVLKAYRKEKSGAPAIFITSLNSMDDVEKGFNSGCDDYIKKPFELKELELRIASLLKRGFLKKGNDRIEIAPEIFFDVEGMALYVKNEEVRLQEKEQKLLMLLLQRRGEVVGHEAIKARLWDYEEEGSDESVRTHIKNLRKILGKDCIVSLKKLGYKLTA